MINLRDRICDVFQAHQYTDPGCTCGWDGVTKAHHDVHLADAVIAELARSECGGDLCECRQCRVIRILEEDDE